MKYLLSAIVAIVILVFWVSPGLTGEGLQSLPGPTGLGGPIRNVILYFEHDTITDQVLLPIRKMNWVEPAR